MRKTGLNASQITEALENLLSNGLLQKLETLPFTYRETAIGARFVEGVAQMHALLGVANLE